MTQTLRKHKHVIIRAFVDHPPMNPQKLEEWCSSVISSVGMKCISGPHVCYSDMVGNAGYTAVAVLDFSHLAIHSWDEVSPGLIEFDLFSCQDFDPDIVIDSLDREFSLVSYSLMVLDRDDFDNEQIGRKQIRSVA